MAKISLKDHLGIIEERIQDREMDAALAHCRHVLGTFPKHVDTYRLMAKAYLEGKRYKDADDIFQRVLSSTPDDFISHVGMSIIREEDGDQEGAVWHMERAFEAQPSNRAVQDELRRLYNNKEGFAPPKVRLTQGALARMYSHGDLHNQAISELNSALSDDPNRPDLELLLAEMYFKTQQINEALISASQLLEKLPYCLSANLLMAEILMSTDREEEATAYIEIAKELDPYSALDSSVEVSPNEYMLEEFDPNSPREIIEEATEPLVSEPMEDHEMSPPSEEAPDSSSNVEDATIEDEEVTKPDEDALAEQEIPEWLRELLPEGELNQEDDQEADQSFATSDSVSEKDELSPAAENAEASEDLGWLEALAAEEGAPEEELITDPTDREPGTPKWLETESPESQTDDSMAWLDELDSNEDSSPSEESLDEAADEEESAVETPQAETPEDQQTPDWLKDLAEEAEYSTQPSGEIQAKSLEQAPEWLDDLQETDDLDEEESAAEESAPMDGSEFVAAEPEEAETSLLEEIDDSAPPLQPEEESDWIPEAIKGENETVLLREESDGKASEELESPQPVPEKPANVVKSESDGLQIARQALNHDKLDDALAHYKKLLRNRDTLDDVLADLQAALSKHPKHVGLWQLLGDAYMGKDRLRDALESYTKAEDLL